MKTKIAMLLLAASLAATVGCSTASFTNTRADNTKTTARFAVPAWPWQDSARALTKLNQSSKTNSYALGLAGFNETEITSSNAVDMITAVVGAAIGAAIKATVKP